MANDILYGEVGAEQPRPDYAHFTPNFELIGKVLDTKQKKYDTNLMTLQKVKAKTDEVNSLEGYDRDRWLTKQQGYDDKVNEIMRLYDGDLSKADGELNNFVFDMSRDFGTHGEATAINARHAGYTADEKELSKRRAENKITEGQYRTLQRELQRTRDTGIGTEKGYWNTWNRVNPTDKVDVEKFMNDFVKNKKEDLVQKWGEGRPNPVTGKIEYRAGEHEYITEESIQTEASNALHNKLQETGQLQADYLWHLESTNTKPTTSKHIEALGNQTNLYQTNINDLNSLKGADLQKKINEVYKQVTGKNIDILSVDGTEGDKTKQAKEQLIEALGQRKTLAQSEMDKMSKFSDEEINAFHYGDWQGRYVNDLVKPWAGAVSYDKNKEDLKIADNPYLDFYHKKMLQQQQHGLNMQLSQFEYNLNNPIVPSVKTKGESFFVEHDIKTLADLDKHKQKQAQNSIQLAADMWSAMTNDKVNPLTLEGGITNSPLGKFMQKMKDISPQDMAKTIANADYKQQGNNVLITFKDNNGKVLHTETVVNTDINRFNDVKARAINHINDDNMVQARVNNASNDVLQNGGYSDTFIDYTKNKDNIENQFKPAISEAHQLYLDKKTQQQGILQKQITQLQKQLTGQPSLDLKINRQISSTQNQLNNLNKERTIGLDEFTKRLSQEPEFINTLGIANPNDPQSINTANTVLKYSKMKQALIPEQIRYTISLNDRLYNTRETPISMNITNEVVGAGRLPQKVVEIYEKALNEQTVGNQANWSSIFGIESATTVRGGNYTKDNFGDTVEKNRKRLSTALGVEPEHIEAVMTTVGGGDIPLPNGENAYGVKVSYRDKRNNQYISNVNGTNSSFTFYVPQSQIMTSMSDKSQTFIYNKAMKPFITPISQGIHTGEVAVTMKDENGESKIVNVKYTLGNNAAFKNNNPNTANLQSIVNFIKPVPIKDSNNNYTNQYEEMNMTLPDYITNVGRPLSINEFWESRLNEAGVFNSIGDGLNINQAKTNLLNRIADKLDPETGALRPNEDYNKVANYLMNTQAVDKYGNLHNFLTESHIFALFPEIHSNGTKNSTIKGRIFDYETPTK